MKDLSLTLNHHNFTNDDALLFPWEKMRLLTSVDLRNCSLTSIPIGISKLDENIVKSVRLEGNSLVGFHKSLVDSKVSAKDIIINLRESLKGGVVPFKEIKVMVVGEPAVGKTTMLKILYGHSSSRELVTRPCVATDGIDLGEMTLEGYRMMFWDFAGQEVYRYTHQLFLSDNSVCLVMFRLTTPDEEVCKQLTYWIDSVLQRAPDAICMIIGTCGWNFSEAESKMRMQKHLEFVQKRYGNKISGGVVIDSLYDYGFKDLKKELLRVTKQKVFELF